MSEGLGGYIQRAQENTGRLQALEQLVRALQAAEVHIGMAEKVKCTCKGFTVQVQGCSCDRKTEMEQAQAEKDQAIQALIEWNPSHVETPDP